MKPQNLNPTLKEPIMKTTTLSAVVATLALSFAAGSAVAQEATYDYPVAAVSQLSRAAVVAELNQARAEGSIAHGEAGYSRATTFVPQFTRAEVQAQTLAAIASGELSQLNRDTNEFAPMQRITPAATVLAGK